MGRIHVNQIKVALNKTFQGKIDLTDLTGKPQIEIDKNFLTRSFAAYALFVLANIDVDTATKAIVDGYEDNGIDGLYFDRNQKILWLIQAKFIEDGAGEPDAGETGKFAQGIRDLIDLKMDRFNARIKCKEHDVVDALNDAYVKLNIVIAYTGQSFSVHNNRIIDDLIKELNDPSPLADFSRFSLKEAHKSLTSGLAGQPIIEEVALTNWGQIEEPYQAFYGQICASDIANWWLEHSRRLFTDNLRNFIGPTDINEGIIGTLADEPNNFIYFNNGITVLCKKIKKKALGGSDKSHGIFVCEGISVVNGAQTVGSIGNAYSKQSDQVKKAKVFIRLISLEACPPEFGTKVTKATNTQNKIEKRDFVTLDPEQERLKTDLALDGKNYHYIRSDEKVFSDDNNCNLEEATIALACANLDVSLAVQAKREIGKLWEDTTMKPYIDIFNSTVSGIMLWRSVQVLRKVNQFLKDKEMISGGREKSFYIHANRFVLHLVLQKMSKQALNDPGFDFNGYQQDLQSLIQGIVDAAKAKLEEKYSVSLIHQVFRNFTKCKDIKSSI